MLTNVAYHPRGALIPRALKASAICRSDLEPARCMARMIGITFAARWFARSTISATAF
jgi:hypothetical protein